jgi:amidohydrolase
LKEGVFETHRPDAVFGLHIWAPLHVGDIGYRSGPLLAGADRFRIVVSGRQTHGARPWQGVDPIVTAAQIVNGLQTVVSRRVDLTRNPAVVTVGSIRGGIRHNIIPDTVELLGTMRTFEPQQRADVMERIQLLAQNIAAANGASATFALGEDRYPVTRNDAALTQQVLPSLARAAGAQHVIEVARETGAEDFSYFADKVPGFFFFVGATPRGRDPATTPANHSPFFYVDENALQVGLRATLYLAVDYLQSGAAPKP